MFHLFLLFWSSFISFQYKTNSSTLAGFDVKNTVRGNSTIINTNICRLASLFGNILVFVIFLHLFLCPSTCNTFYIADLIVYVCVCSWVRSCVLECVCVSILFYIVLFFDWPKTCRQFWYLKWQIHLPETIICQSCAKKQTNWYNKRTFFKASTLRAIPPSALYYQKYK